MDQPRDILYLASSQVALFDDGRTETKLPSGRVVEAYPHFTSEYIARAHDLGYHGDIFMMSREHEVGHSLLALIFGLEESPTLKGVSENDFWPFWRAEEGAVMGLQAFARALNVDLVDVARRLSQNQKHDKRIADDQGNVGEREALGEALTEQEDHHRDEDQGENPDPEGSDHLHASTARKTT